MKLENNELEEVLRQLNEYEILQETRNYAIKTTKIVGFIMGFAIAFLTVSYLTGRSISFEKSSKIENDDIQSINKKILILEQRIEVITATPTAITNSKLNLLANDLDVIKKRNNYIDELILNNPEKLITAKILRDEQVKLSKDVDGLKDSYENLFFYILGVSAIIVGGLLSIIAKTFTFTPMSYSKKTKK
jgi:hypothetical protein